MLRILFFFLSLFLMITSNKIQKYGEFKIFMSCSVQSGTYTKLVHWYKNIMSSHSTYHSNWQVHCKEFIVCQMLPPISSICSTRSPFLLCLLRRAQSGSTSFGRRVWLTESHLVSILFFFYLLFYLLILFLILKWSCCVQLNN